MGGFCSACIGFKVLSHKANEALKAVSKLKGVVGEPASVSCRFDTMAIVMFNMAHSCQLFLEDELRKVEGLLSSETFFAIGGDPHIGKLVAMHVLADITYPQLVC